MKTIRILMPTLFLFLFISQVDAQQTEYYENVKKEIDLAKELYSKGKYISTYRQFEKIQKKVEERSELYSEAEYYKAVSALKAGYGSGYKLIKKFVDTHPESPYINSAWFNLGKTQFEKRQYTQVIRSFAKVNRKELSEKDRIELQYQNGFANLEKGSVDKAYSEFTAIKNTNNLYAKPSTYYCAHIQYLNEDFDAALDGFKQLQNEPAYSQVIPLYVSHIYYKQGKYTEVVNYTTSVINDVQEEHKTELSKIIGDSYFHLEQYSDAIPYLETYFKESGPKTREENYILGFCYYHAGSYEAAVPLLKLATTGEEDEMTQNAYYHLADCFIKMNDKEKAKTAYGAASEFDFNAEIKEDALFSFAKLTYELSYSPFNETIKAFDKYIAEYPNSPKNTEAYKILVDVYMVTKNYNDAIESINKIQNKTPDILRAYQRVTYFRGLELFNNRAYNDAIELFDESLANSSHSAEIKANTLYWKSEALYRLGDYNGSIASYNQFMKSSGSSASANLNADYNLGYAYLKMNDKEAAHTHFTKYVNKMQGKRIPKMADAYNRIGDYYFLQTNYDRAIQNYRQAYSMNMLEADYALLQIAFCQGLQRQQQLKINNLEKLLNEFRESEYKDDALYELGRANERLGNNYEAVQQYQQIVSNFPHSEYYRKALLQLGLVNYNNGDFNKALKQYKEVAENFKGSPEAKSALSGIKNCYVELNNVNAYFAYVRKLGGDATVSATEQDQLTYMAAERVYMAGETNSGQQLQQYLQQFPNGAYATNAHFYLAETLYKDGQYSAANQHYTWVANQPDNIFTEQALSRASEMTFSAQNYDDALLLFNRLEQVSNGKWNLLKANAGQMRCHLIAKDYNKVITAAEKVSKSEVANEAIKNEADYAQGKSHYELGNLSSAKSPLRDVANDTKLEAGAEAKYLLAEIYYKEKNLAKAEEEIVDFIEKGTPYTFWLGKSFLLLANIYEDKGDQFQAKHTLKSLAENYNSENDGVKAEAQRRYDEILAKEAQQQQNAVDSSFQMKIKQN